MKCSMTPADQRRSAHAPGTSCSSGRSQAGWPRAAAQALGHGDLEAPALSWALQLNRVDPQSGLTRSVRRPSVAGAEAQPVLVQAGARCLHGSQAGSSDSRPFDTQGSCREGSGRGVLRLWASGGPARLGAVLPAAPCEGEPWPLAPHGSSRTARPTRLIPHSSSGTAHPAHLIPHSSSPTACPARLIAHSSSCPAHPARLAPHACRCPGVRWVGSGAGRESGKQETGSAEHCSRATRNRAQAKNSSRAAPGVGQPLFGREGVLPPPVEPLGHSPRARRKLPGELPGSCGAGPAIREEEPRRGRGLGEEPSKHHEEQKQHGAEGCGACWHGMGKGRGLSQSQAPRGPGCLPRLLQGAGAACTLTGNTQCCGDRGPPATAGWAPRAPRQPDLSFLGSSMAEGPRLRRGLTPLPMVSRASIPTPADGDGTGSRGPRTAPASSPSPAVSPAPASAAVVPGNGGSGWETGRMGGPRFSPRPRTHHEAAARPAARGAGTEEEPRLCCRPGAAA